MGAMTGRRELWEVTRFSGRHRGFQPQCDCYRTEVGRAILPRENEPDLEELPSEARDALRFVLVDSIDEVFDAAFSSNGAATNGRAWAATSER